MKYDTRFVSKQTVADLVHDFMDGMRHHFHVLGRPPIAGEEVEGTAPNGFTIIYQFAPSNMPVHPILGMATRMAILDRYGNVVASTGEATNKYEKNL